jgi:hypothetical protein
MKSAEDIKKYFQKSTLSTNRDKHEAIFEKIQRAQEKSKTTAPASYRLNLRSNIMKSPIIKLAAAAVIIVLVVLGLFEFIGTGSTSSVVWADVARKVQASRGTIFRSTDADGSGHAMHYHSSTQYRNDSFRGGQIDRTNYGDLDTSTVIAVSHRRKTYATRTFPNLEIGRFWADPKRVIQSFLSHEHRELGARTVEGVLCEGIETTDPASSGLSFPVDSLMARVWVSVETGYPIKYEYELVGRNGEDGQLLRFGGIADQFQWDVELDESLFEPDIPADYIYISPGE